MELKSDEPFYQISQVAKLLGITSDRLRTYEEEGLIKPYRTKHSKDGKRLFTKYDIEWLSMLRDLIKLGVSIPTIRILLLSELPEKIKFCREKDIEILNIVENLKNHYNYKLLWKSDWFYPNCQQFCRVHLYAPIMSIINKPLNVKQEIDFIINSCEKGERIAVLSLKAPFMIVLELVVSKRLLLVLLYLQSFYHPLSVVIPNLQSVRRKQGNNIRLTPKLLYLTSYLLSILLIK